MKTNYLLDPSPGTIMDGGGGGGGATTPKPFIESIPEAYRSEPSLANIKSLEDLTKGYVNAQKLIGGEKIPAPQKNWNEAQWAEHFDRLGRPKTHDEYGIPEDVKPVEGLTLDETRLAKFKEQFHKLGLTKEQGNKLLGAYIQSLNETEGQVLQQLTTAKEKAVQTLQAELGDKYATEIQLAQHTASQLGGDELMAALRESGLGNDPRVIKAFIKAGRLLSEDGDRPRGFTPMTGKGGAVQELAKLRGDKEFMDAFTNRSHPAHQDAVDRFASLQKAAAQ